MALTEVETERHRAVSIVGASPLNTLHQPDRTEWHRVEIFGKAAQVARDYLSKGRQVYIEGSIRYDEWTDKDGNKRNTTKIHIGGPNSRLVLLGGRGEGGGMRPSGGGGGGEAGTSEPPAGEDFKVSDDDVPF